MENLLEKREFSQVEKLRIERVNSIVDALRKADPEIKTSVKVLSIDFSRCLIYIDYFVVDKNCLDAIYQKGCKIVLIQPVLLNNSVSPVGINLLLEY